MRDNSCSKWKKGKSLSLAGMDRLAVLAKVQDV